MDQPTTVLVFTRESDAPYRKRLIDSGDVRYRFCASEEEIEAQISEADVVLGSVAFPARLLDRAVRLRWIQVTGAGVDAFLAQGRLPEGVVLTRVDTSFGDRIAEYVVGHLLARVLRIQEVYRQQAERRWAPLETQRLCGRTMGIAGTGAIGRAVAARGRGLGMRTVGLSRSGRRVDAFDWVHPVGALAEFLAGLDVLVLCLPLTAETRGMIDAEQLACMKPSAILVNVARGPIVDASALGDALRNGTLAGAILDVFAQEPLPESSPLWSLDNVTVTSHQAGLNEPDEIVDFFLDNLRRLRAGEPLRGLVDLRRGY